MAIRPLFGGTIAIVPYSVGATVPIVGNDAHIGPHP